MPKTEQSKKIRELGSKLAAVMDEVQILDDNRNGNHAEAADALDKALDYIDSAIRTLEGDE